MNFQRIPLSEKTREEINELLTSRGLHPKEYSNEVDKDNIEEIANEKIEF